MIDANLNPGEANRRRVADILAASRALKTSPYSKSDIDELTSIMIDQQGADKEAVLLGRHRDVPIPPQPGQSVPTSNVEKTLQPPRSLRPSPWVPAGEAVSIAGQRIEGGMIYVGTHLDSSSNSNCLIDPKLGVGSVPDFTGSAMGYWPSYSGIRPQERRAYLEWLATGRQQTDIGVGYVFLFFYGLERRMFIDEAYEDRPSIEAEVRRLLSIYGSNGSFRGYATRFLDAVSLLDWDGETPPEISLDLRGGYELPNSVKLHIGSKLSQKLALTAHDALLWVICSPETSLRTPAIRCFEEFKTLWNILFADAFPEGMKVATPKTRLKVNYRAAMGFSGTVKVMYGGEELPDVSNLSAPLEKLRDIVHRCTDALDPYSRYLGRNPDSGGTLAAARLLPTELIGTKSHPVLVKIGDGIFQLLRGQDAGFAPGRDLVSLLEIDEASNGITRSQCIQIGTILDKLDFALEPDCRYGASGFSGDDMVYLFKASGGAKIDAASPAYNLYRMMVEVAALASAADGRLLEQEFEVIGQTIATGAGLSEIEKTRLSGLAASLWKNVPKQQSVLKRLADLPEPEKRQVADTAIAAIMADGHVDPKEVAFLEKLYKALGYPAEDVYSALHRGSASSPGSVGVDANSGPSKIATDPNTIQFDLSRLERIKGETDIVSQMLANIFTDDVPAPVAAKRQVEATTAMHRFTGLDAEHGELFAAIVLSGKLRREEFDTKARALKLLPDGALETINEWGFDHLDEPVLDGEDILTIPAHLLEQLKEYVVA